jgi:hypothetical protein
MRRVTMGAIAPAVVVYGGLASAETPGPDSKDARAIMEAVETRDLGDRMTARISMTIVSGKDKRGRVMRLRRMRASDGLQTLIQFERPADMRSTGLLTLDYDDGGKEDAQWLYLPSTRKTIRTSGGEKSGSFVGSDVSYHDMTRHHAKEWEYTLLNEQAKVGDETVWVIEAKPRTDRMRDESGYLKVHYWISKRSFVAVQLKAWMASGKKLKYMKLTELAQIDGIWVPHKIAARTVRGDKVESTTVMVWDKVKFGVEDVSAEDFTERRLEQGI